MLGCWDGWRHLTAQHPNIPTTTTLPIRAAGSALSPRSPQIRNHFPGDVFTPDPTSVAPRGGDAVDLLVAQIAGGVAAAGAGAFPARARAPAPSSAAC